MTIPNPEGFIAFEINHEEFIQAYKKISADNSEIAVSNYLKLCKILLLSGKNLSDFMKETLIFSAQPLVEKYVREKENNPYIYKAICYDLQAVSEICSLSSESVKKILSERFDKDFSNLPDFEKGEFNYNAQYFIESCKNNGSGIFAKYKAFYYRNSEKTSSEISYLDNHLKPVNNPDPIRLSDLKRYEVQRKQIIDNTICFLNGKPADNVLLYGDRGTGKSSTIKALLNEYSSLRMIQLDKNDISAISELYHQLGNIPLYFIIFIDDLCFSEDDDGFFVLKQALDGALTAKPKNILIYATTNRRHIIKETSANRADSYVHKSDAVDDNMSLSDRFGLFVTFSSPNKEQFVDIGLKIAADRGLNMDKEEFESGIERFALKRGGRSPRIAKQYVDYLEGRLSLNQ